jgi:hypothetical protein
MARQNSFKYKIDIEPLKQFGERLGSISESQIGQATVEALNTITEGLYELGRDRMIKNINLDDSYVKGKMELTKATVGNPTSSVRADGRDTVLGRFDAKPVTASTVSPAGKLKGNPRLGIPAGRKQAGVTVRVQRDQVNSDFVPRGFLLPLRAGNVDGGNGLGVFARSRDGTLKHRYGPSPYQLFRKQIPDLLNEADEAFEIEATDRVGELLRKALE